jgi:hypothetical protein
MTAGIDHGLNRQGHPGLQANPPPRFPEIRNLGLLMQVLADAVPHKIAHNGEAVGFHMPLNRRGNILQAILRPGPVNRQIERLFRNSHKPLGLCGDAPNG